MKFLSTERIVRILAIVLLSSTCILALPVHGQDATAEPPIVVTVIAPTETPADTGANDAPSTTAILGVVFTVALVIIGGLFALFGTKLMSALETLLKSVPALIRTGIVYPAIETGLNELERLASETLDDYDDKEVANLRQRWEIVKSNVDQVFSTQANQRR